MTEAEIKAIDDRWKKREEELLALLLVLFGHGVEQAVGADDPLRIMGLLLLAHGVPEIAESMADAHIDSFDVYQATPPAGRRDELIREYTGTATEAVIAMQRAIAKGMKAAQGDLPGALLIAKYSRSDSTNIQLGAERNIVTASNAGLFEGAVLSRTVNGLEHISVIDGRTTDICRERDRLKLPVTDKYWETNWPSLHERCRSIIQPISGEFVPSVRLPTVPPDDGFGEAPDSVIRLLRQGVPVSRVRKGRPAA